MDLWFYLRYENVTLIQAVVENGNSSAFYSEDVSSCFERTHILRKDSMAESAGEAAVWALMAQNAENDLKLRRRSSGVGPKEEAVLINMTPEKRALIEEAIATGSVPGSLSSSRRNSLDHAIKGPSLQAPEAIAKKRKKKKKDGKEEDLPPRREGATSLPQLTSPNKALHQSISPAPKGHAIYGTGRGAGSSLLGAIKAVNLGQKMSKKVHATEGAGGERGYETAPRKRKAAPSLDPMLAMNQTRVELKNFLTLRGVEKKDQDKYINKAIQKYNVVHPR